MVLIFAFTKKRCRPPTLKPLPALKPSLAIELVDDQCKVQVQV